MDEWTPFSAKRVVDTSFRLPVSNPRPISVLGQYYPNPLGDEEDLASDNFLCVSPFLPSSCKSSPSWSGMESQFNSPLDTIHQLQHDLLELPPPQELPQMVLPAPIRLRSIYRGSERALVLYHGPVSSPKEQELIRRLELSFSVRVAKTLAEAKNLVMQIRFDALITQYGEGRKVCGPEIVRTLRSLPHSAQVFVIVFANMVTENALLVTECNQVGANMITDSIEETVTTAVRALKPIGRDPFTHDEMYQCPLCGFNDLKEDELSEHVVLYHAGQPNCHDVMCPVCGVMCKNVKLPFPVHVHKAHGPVGRFKQAIPKKQHHTYIFTLVVTHRKSDNKFLLVNEPASWGWWIPGGRVEWSEGLKAAAMREVKDEAGVNVNIEGILKIEYAPGPSRTRQRFIFFATPVDETRSRAKCVPDYQSRGACWVTLEELEVLPLRGEEPKKWFKYVAEGGAICPISALAVDGEA
eukprot:c7086_g1_i2.p1 GENE.c7086_g1_i2~~c7086_g1_i2.p1  ORF type:complete len:480 (+),score=47.94 c7086_g1_i2:40-1440(+)